uniref:Putative secreted protein n=1 Tax=Ixodes scapularis TaxID=6945 RepID=A0A4D5RAV8_IXOSC
MPPQSRKTWAWCLGTTASKATAGTAGAPRALLHPPRATPKGKATPPHPRRRLPCKTFRGGPAPRRPFAPRPPRRKGRMPVSLPTSTSHTARRLRRSSGDSCRLRPRTRTDSS